MKAIFGHAAELTGPERDRFVDEATDGDDALRAEVRSLLGGLDSSDGWWSSPTLDGHGVPADVPMPESLGRYQVRALLGRGGMGRVYLAHDPLLGRDVALKVLPRSLAEHPDRRARFLVESRAAARLNHPNITTIHEIGEADGTDFIAMEYVQGQSLAELMSTRGLDVEELLDICVPLADALAFAHEHGVIHRDIKPANVMVTDRGTAKLLDFGLAKWTGVAMTPAAEGAPPSRRGEILGTPGAMSPEQAEGRQLDHRSDVFSLGSLLYELVSGRPAFADETVLRTMAAVVREEPEALPDDETRCPPALRAVIERALRKDPGERYQSVAELAADLRTLRDRTGRAAAAGPLPAPNGPPPADTLPTDAPPATFPLRLVSGLGALLGVIFLIAWWQTPSTPPDLHALLAETLADDPLSRALLDARTPSPELLALVDAFGTDGTGGLVGITGLDRVLILRRRADALATLGRFDDATELYRLAVGVHGPIGADDALTHARNAARHGLARMLQLQGDDVAARDEIEHALAWQPDGPRCLFMAAHFARERGDLLEIDARLDQLQRLTERGDDPTASFHEQAVRAELALAEGDAQLARSRYEVLLDAEVLARDWSVAGTSIGPLLRRGLAQSCLALGDGDGALDALEDLIDSGLERLGQPGSWVRALYARGRLQVDRGRHARGRASLEQFLAWWGDVNDTEVDIARGALQR